VVVATGEPTIEFQPPVPLECSGVADEPVGPLELPLYPAGVELVATVTAEPMVPLIPQL
jgi:hypothetical protein